MLVAAAWAANSYARSRAYLINENGVVVVYQGVPGSFAGISMNWRSSETTIPVSELSPITATRLQEGIRVGGLAEADTLLAEYRAMLPTEPSTVPTP